MPAGHRSKALDVLRRGGAWLHSTRHRGGRFEERADLVDAHGVRVARIGTETFYQIFTRGHLVQRSYTVLPKRNVAKYVIRPDRKFKFRN